MDIYGLLIATMGQFLALANGSLSAWVNVPEGASGAWDANVTLTSPGSSLLDNIAAMVVATSDIVSDLFGTLF